MASLTITTDLLKRASLDCEARELRESFPEFAARAWREIDTTPLQRGWFVDLLWSELELWGRGEPGYSHLAIAVPPGSSKSISASVLLQAWMWTRDPTQMVLAVACVQDLAVRDTRKMRSLVESQWYRERFCREWSLTDDQNQKMYFENTAKGSRKALGLNSNKIGWRSDISIADDLVKYDPKKPPKPEDYDEAYRAAQNIFRTRVNNPLKARALLIAQRLHEDDPIGRILREEPERWRAVFFDAKYDPAMPHRHPGDPRQEPGELLLPYLHDDAFLADTRETLGTDFYTAQYQQTPAATGGMIIHPNWFQEYEEYPENLPYTIISWDCAFKGEATSSWVVGSVWGVEAPNDPHMRRYYLRDLVREQLDYPSTKRAIERLASKYPEADYIVIEDKANGPAVISELRHKLPNIVGFNPSPYGDKEQRLRAISPIFESGKVWIPKEAEWREAYVSELTRFPKVSDADQVDSTTQIVIGSAYHLEDWEKQVNSNQAPAIYFVDLLGQ